ncbi:MAG TPA: DoxX family protein [Polyangiaceae bacterium]|nr:DoxX family protein [Polyangiaceae bacterium]
MLTRKLPTVVRVLLGLVFFVFGLNGFLQFLPQPPMPGPAGQFIGALVASGYLFPLLKLTEVVAGAMLLANRFVPLALALLAPIIVNIAAFHTLLAPGYPMVAFLLGTELYLAWVYRDAFRPMLRAAVAPRVGEAESSAPSAKAAAPA